MIAAEPARGLRPGTAGARREADARIGLVIFLGATAMLFAALLLGYAIVRAQAAVWPPVGQATFPRAAAGFNTAVLAAVGLALRRGRAIGRRAPLLLAFALGAIFLVLQLLLLARLGAARLGPGAGVLADVFFALSVLHALHVAGGLAGLAASGGRRLPLLILYFDFVLMVWIVVYVAVCWL